MILLLRRKYWNNLNQVTRISDNETVIDGELLEFAELFSNKYHILSTGEYFSKNRKYQIRYTGYLMDNLKPTNNPARIGHVTGIIEISKAMVNGTNSNYVFFLIVWCYFIKHHKCNYIQADNDAINYYTSLGKSLKDIYSNFIIAISNNQTELNKNRIEKINKLIHYQEIYPTHTY